jgi:glycogen debranching enzyme
MDDFAEPATTDESAAAAVVELLSLKDQDSFLVADRQGDIGGGTNGFFVRDTRILSQLTFLIGDQRPSPLSHGLSQDSAVFPFHGTNRALPPAGGGRGTPRGAIHVERKRVLHNERMYERVRGTNFGLDQVMLPLAFEYAADFRDIFEVRGFKRRRRGTILEPQVSGRHVVFSYEGLDDVRRTCVVAFSEPPWRMDAHRAEFMFALSPGEHMDIYIEAGVEEEEQASRERFASALMQSRVSIRQRERRGARLRCPNGALDAWLDQSRADISLLTTDLPTGPYPYAGIPWFSTPFGRDGILTSWQMLWLDPSIARGVLRYLAKRQAHKTSAFRDSRPGKIMHETRHGEVSGLKEVPFGIYYGGVDTTPLFVALAGAYLTRTDDAALIRELWPALTAAMDWVERNGDSNGDGFIDYQRGADTGLANQGWKDSADSVFHADGRFPVGPIALVEVQGYAYGAFHAMARMAERLGENDPAAWAAKAEALRERVEARFWMEDAGFYGIAIDGEGKLCTPHASNAGHLLFMGLASPARAERVTQRLLSEDFNSGWGLRTLAAETVRYNPMSYHNGSVWPHDTSLCVAGMAHYGERAGAARILGNMFQAAQSHAGADLRLSPRERRPADRLSGRLHAAGLGGGIGVPPAAGLPGRLDPGRRTHGAGGAPRSATGGGPAAYRRPRGRRRARQPALPAAWRRRDRRTWPRVRPVDQGAAGAVTRT